MGQTATTKANRRCCRVITRPEIDSDDKQSDKGRDNRSCMQHGSTMKLTVKAKVGVDIEPARLGSTELELAR
jgi:hypothetical protein